VFGIPRVRKAFTTIELLIAIAVLVILVGIVMFGMKGITNSSKTRATHMALENARALLAEREAVSGLGAGPPDWIYENDYAATPVPKQFVAAAAPLSYWKIPYQDTSGPLPVPLPVQSPPDVRTESADDRNGSIPIINTTLIMSQLGAVPANRSILLKLPKEQTFMPLYVSGKEYPRGARVTYNGNFYIATANVLNQTPPTAPWASDPSPLQMLRDGWGNPIIFVPASGIVLQMKGDQTDYDKATPPLPQYRYIIISPEGQVSRDPASKIPFVTRPGRPFFASAGPDGDFSKGDDNIYSFEK
jgi:type II secretory pathway pseudopilin PulG